MGGHGWTPRPRALDLALHDRLGQSGLPLYRLLGLPVPLNLPTSFTIAIDTPEAVAELARQAAIPVIKIKVGSDPEDLARGGHPRRPPRRSCA